MMQSREQFLENARQICELQHFVIDLVVITSYSIHYTKLYEEPSSRRSDWLQYLTRSGANIGMYLPRFLL